MHITNYKLLQAEVVTKLRNFAEACTHSSAKRITVHGRTGLVNAVEADGALFIENDEAGAESVRLKVLEPLRHTTLRSTIHDNHHEHPPPPTRRPSPSQLWAHRHRGS